MRQARQRSVQPHSPPWVPGLVLWSMQHVPSVLLPPRRQAQEPSFSALHAEQTRPTPQYTSVEVRWASRGVTMLTTFAQSGRLRRHNPRLGQMYSMPGGRTPIKFVSSRHTSRHHLGKDPTNRSHSHVGPVFQMPSVGTFVTRMPTPTPRQTDQAKARTSMLVLQRRQPLTKLLSHEACEKEPTVE